ncbi:MAG: DUF3368 domain-containing protein [Chloroflexi bacterium]|nr:DUF3368 domain-containing protein [Chloroflexota bacterium]MBP7043349.1 DUF3368 domain-containing protein [Chloroflexota bacterium]
MIVVSDTSPLMNMAIISQLEILTELYGEVVIPQAVHDELVLKGQGMPGSQQIRSLPWLTVRQVRNDSLVIALRLQLDRGESEAIALAIELGADLLLIDERKARAVAQQFNLEYTGLLGLLIEAKEKGFITAVEPLLRSLREKAGFWISDPLYDYVLRSAGE